MFPPIVQGYLALTHVLSPIYGRVMDRRADQGKEDKQRLGERFGYAGRSRPEGRLIWFHAASVGESLSLEPVIKEILAEWDDVSVLVTSGTLTSAKVLAETLPAKAFHQFAPIDTPSAMRRFLKHWKPDLAIWTESEIWPRMIVETHRAKVPMALINARVSDKTARQWQKFPRSIASLLNLFDIVLTQEEPVAETIRAIGVTKARAIGSTKQDAAPLPVDADVLNAIQHSIGDRDVWLAASTHQTEEEHVVSAQQFLGQGAPFLIVAPRHPERGDEVTEMFRAAGFAVAQRSKSEPIDDDVQVYVADTVGEMGLWYRIAKYSFVGGSLAPVGGHNPFEPVALGSAVISGTKVFNFDAVYERLDRAHGYVSIADPSELGYAVQALINNPDERDQMVQRALESTRLDGTATERVIAAIKAYL
ncbi:hypothetical protein BVC71_12370 [Marivivens niveibacter]|uniref:3-deoxy-D-manno-octulosonic acid transferase n=1 Tax=Marivivens niveibacter TaxID=1930667 RepID=A0A251WWA0_9RHOB|nr:3-deoxy-D-manno-octulosonic acid transferase [Marivivens niveibacter]OUD08717.1 hypothetical protein BVC71_12370 [Marivivens niveibacter]